MSKDIIVLADNIHGIRAEAVAEKNLEYLEKQGWKIYRDDDDILEWQVEDDKGEMWIVVMNDMLDIILIKEKDLDEWL